jgi:site-specific DNA-methyltransferase (adenine-specific)
VALVITSPPYFVGKDYETTGPVTYEEYLIMLRDIFKEAARTLEPGGRMAVNVANLGRRPYRSLSKEIWKILEEDLGLLPRGEIIWIKAQGASGNCAFGSFCKPSNPVLRDVTERILVVSKGRFDRALAPKERQELGLPHEATIKTPEFLEYTLDTW